MAIPFRPRTTAAAVAGPRPPAHAGSQAAAQPDATSDAASVLSKAVVRSAGLMELSQTQLARVLGTSAPTASRLTAGHWRLAPDSKPWELATLLVRVFRALDALTGGQADARRAWLSSYNHALGAEPASLLTRTEGLVSVLRYLDAARAR